MALKWKTKIILAKTEVTYGVDPTPTGAANAVLCTDVSLNPMDGQDISRALELPYRGAAQAASADQDREETQGGKMKIYTRKAGSQRTSIPERAEVAIDCLIPGASQLVLLVNARTFHFIEPASVEEVDELITALGLSPAAGAQGVRKCLTASPSSPARS